MATERPHRRLRGTLDFEADDLKALRGIFNALSFRTREGPITNIASGGWESSWSIVVAEDHEQTGDNYREQLDAYLAEKRDS